MAENKKHEMRSIASLLGVFPPFALLFIIAGWLKGNKVSTLSVVGVIAAVAFSIIFVMQLYKPL